MKLEKIYIGAFGGLEDYTLELADGLNVIYGQNENGKSTLMAFIKMMFYGSGKRSGQLSQSPRARYTPWSGKMMCGRVYFEHGGTRFCLEREFRKSDSTDKITLRNMDLGTSENVASDIGTRFFGLTAAAFEKSNFVSVLSVSSKDETAAGELGSKLSNLVLTGDESVSSQAVEARLAAAREALISKSAKKGDYVMGCVKLEALENELKSAGETAEKKAALTAEAEAQKAQYLQLKAEYDRLSEIISREADIRNAEKLREYLEVKARLDELSSTLKMADGKTADEMFVKTARFALNRYEMQAKKVDALAAEIKKSEEAITLSSAGNTDELKAEVEQINSSLTAFQDKHSALEAELEAVRDRQNELANSKPVGNGNTSLMLVAAGLFALSGVALFAITKSLYTALLIIAAVLMMALALCFRSRATKARSAKESEQNSLIKAEAEARTKIAHLAEERTAARDRLSVITAALSTDEALRRQRAEELSVRREGLKAEQERAELEFDELIKHFSRYNAAQDTDEIHTLLDALEGKTEELKTVKQQLSYISRDLGNISYEQAAQKLENMPQDKTSDTDFVASKQRAEELRVKINEITAHTAEILAELKSGFADVRNPQEISKEISALKETLAKQKDFYDSLELASSILAESFTEVRRGYGSTLEARAVEIFSRLTRGRYTALNVSKALDMTVEQSGVFGTHELDYLSAGTADQAYLSLRLAIVELIAEGDTLPLFLDDVLSQYDDIRAEEAMAFLKDYCQKTQALLFTCHNSICSFAKENGVEVKTL